MASDRKPLEDKKLDHSSSLGVHSDFSDDIFEDKEIKPLLTTYYKLIDEENEIESSLIQLSSERESATEQSRVTTIAEQKEKQEREKAKLENSQNKQLNLIYDELVKKNYNISNQPRLKELQLRLKKVLDAIAKLSLQTQENTNVEIIKLTDNTSIVENLSRYLKNRHDHEKFKKHIDQLIIADGATEEDVLFSAIESILNEILNIYLEINIAVRGGDELIPAYMQLLKDTIQENKSENLTHLFNIAQQTGANDRFFALTNLISAMNNLENQKMEEKIEGLDEQTMEKLEKQKKTEHRTDQLIYLKIALKRRNATIAEKITLPSKKIFETTEIVSRIKSRENAGIAHLPKAKKDHNIDNKEIESYENNLYPCYRNITEAKTIEAAMFAITDLGEYINDLKKNKTPAEQSKIDSILISISFGDQNLLNNSIMTFTNAITEALNDASFKQPNAATKRRLEFFNIGLDIFNILKKGDKSLSPTIPLTSTGRTVTALAGLPETSSSPKTSEQKESKLSLKTKVLASPQAKTNNVNTQKAVQFIKNVSLYPRIRKLQKWYHNLSPAKKALTCIGIGVLVVGIAAFLATGIGALVSLGALTGAAIGTTAATIGGFLSTGTAAAVVGSVGTAGAIVAQTVVTTTAAATVIGGIAAVANGIDKNFDPTADVAVSAEVLNSQLATASTTQKETKNYDILSSVTTTSDSKTLTKSSTSRTSESTSLGNHKKNSPPVISNTPPRLIIASPTPSTISGESPPILQSDEDTPPISPSPLNK